MDVQKDTDASSKDAYVISYMTFRKVVGWTACALPLAVLFGGMLFEQIPMLNSVSQYYYSSMRDFMVGLLCAVGLFLLTYRGVTRWDSFLAGALGVIVICIALAPMDPTYSDVIQQRFPRLNDPQCYVTHGPLHIHDRASAVFFALMSYMVIFRFPLTKNSHITPEKKRRNVVYVVCGVTMVVCVVLIAIQLVRTPQGTAHGSIFWQEMVALFSFGVAWLTKGQQKPFFEDKGRRTIPTAGRNRWCFGKEIPRPDSLETV